MPPSKRAQLKLRNRDLRPDMRPKVSVKLRETLRAHFDRMDVKGSGRIDAAGLWGGLAELGIRISQAEVLDLIHTADVNRTGTLEFAEFEDLWAIHMVSTSDEDYRRPIALEVFPMLARALSSHELVSRCISAGMNRDTEQAAEEEAVGADGQRMDDADQPAESGHAPPTSSAAATSTLTAGSPAPADTPTAAGASDASQACGAPEVPAAGAPPSLPPMTRMRSVTFINGSEPRVWPGSSVDVSDGSEPRPESGFRVATTEAGPTQKAAPGVGSAASGSSSGSRPSSRESESRLAAAVPAARLGPEAAAAATASLDARQGPASLDAKLGPSRQGSADALAPDPGRPRQSGAAALPAETEAARGRRLSAAQGEAAAVRRLSQLGSMPGLSLLERRRSLCRPTPVRISVSAYSRGAPSAASDRPMSAASSYSVSTPGRPTPPPNRAAHFRTKSGFTPRFLPTGYRPPSWAGASIAEATAGAPAGSGERRQEMNQQYASAWRETEALVDEYSVLREEYEREWLGVQRRSPPAPGQSRVVLGDTERGRPVRHGAAGEAADRPRTAPGSRPNRATYTQPGGKQGHGTDKGPRGCVVAVAGAGAAGVRRSPFVDEYRARKAELAELVYNESEEGLAAAATGLAVREAVERSCVELLARSSQGWDKERASMRPHRAARTPTHARPGPAASAPAAAVFGSRLARPASAPNLALPGRLAFGQQKGDRPSAPATTAPTAAVATALDMHNPPAALLATFAGTLPSAADPRTATDMRIRQLAHRTAREAARDGNHARHGETVREATRHSWRDGLQSARQGETGRADTEGGESPAAPPAGSPGHDAGMHGAGSGGGSPAGGAAPRLEHMEGGLGSKARNRLLARSASAAHFRGLAAAPSVRIWSAPPRHAAAGAPLRASVSAASLWTGRSATSISDWPAGIPPPPSKRLLASSASHPGLAAFEWSIRPGSSPAI